MLNYVDCPACDGDGYDGFDEQGMRYTCYACSETGRMTQRERDAYMCGVNEDPEYSRLKPLVYVEADEYDAWECKRKIFPWARSEQRTVVEFDDIPF